MTTLPIELEPPVMAIKITKYHYFTLNQNSVLSSALFQYKKQLYAKYTKQLNKPSSDSFIMRITIPYYSSIASMNEYIKSIYRQINNKKVDISDLTNYMLIDGYFYLIIDTIEHLILVGQFHGTVPYYNDLLQLNPFKGEQT